MNDLKATNFSPENPYKNIPYTGKGYDTARWVLPLIGLAEVIGSKGASQGQYSTGLMNQMRQGQQENVEKAESWEERQRKLRLEAIARQQLEDELTSNKEMQTSINSYITANPNATEEDIQGELFRIASKSLLKRGDLKSLLEYGARAREAEANRQYRSGESEENRLAREAEAKRQREFQAGQAEQNRTLTREIAGGKLEAKEKEKQEKTEQAISLKNEIVDLVEEIKADPGFSTGLNPLRIKQAIPGSPEFAFKKKIENLKGRLSLDARQKLKGQGQISDYEAKMLEKATSMLDMGLSKKDMIIELNRIRDIMNPGAGMQGKVKKVWNPKTGTFDTIEESQE